MKILLFVADRPFSDPAIAYAGMLARLSPSQVNLLYVARGKRGQANGEQALAEAKSKLGGLQVETYLRTGNPMTRLGEEARKQQYDMVLIGARPGLGYMQRTLASLSQQTVDQAPVSVIVVRHPRAKLERMLICTSGQESALRLTEAGAQLAKQTGARATLLYVSAMVPSMYTGLGEIKESLGKLLYTETPTARYLRRGAEILDQHGVEAELKLCYGTVAEEILNQAEEGDYDLIVIGASKAKRSLRGWVMGDVTRQLVDRANVPVLVVK